MYAHAPQPVPTDSALPGKEGGEMSPVSICGESDKYWVDIRELQSPYGTVIACSHVIGRFHTPIELSAMPAPSRGNITPESDYCTLMVTQVL